MATVEIREVLKRHGITKKKFSDCIITLIFDARAILENKLLYSWPAIDLSTLTDDYNNFYTSFIDRESNNLQPFTRITDIAENYRQRAGSSSASPSKVAYRRSLEMFLEYMLLLFLLTGGLSDHGEKILAKSNDPGGELVAELIVLKHRAQPDPDGKPIIYRAIFMDHHHNHHRICIQTPDMLDPAGKEWRMRFLPMEVSEMVVLYLACVLPFFRTLAPEDAYSTSDDIFAHPSGGIWHTARFERVLKRETEARMGVSMDLNTVNDIISKVSGILVPQSMDLL